MLEVLIVQWLANRLCHQAAQHLRHATRTVVGQVQDVFAIRADWVEKIRGAEPRLQLNPHRCSTQQLYRVATETIADKEIQQASEWGSGSVRVRFHIIRNARIYNVFKYQSCMVSKLRIISRQTVLVGVALSGYRAASCACFLISTSSFQSMK